MSSAARSASLSSGSRLPKITRWITSSVTACIRGRRLAAVAGRPRVELRVGDLGDRRRPALERLAVEGRQHQPALAQVLVAVQDQHASCGR